eukprot:TRINITY_DN479_c0_g3_i1.p1 TRINITY_DN479_c0_g3~~TRINITY_DN479_c0_g3_i1.p1  ORF type:complete len:509 (+),score=88.71 TRINITY_DN479_c0_g3_i1:319-1845(+)
MDIGSEVEVAVKKRLQDYLSEHEVEALNRVLKVFARCFLIGCSGRTILNALYLIVSRLGAKKRRNTGKIRLWDIIDWRFGMFLGGFSAGYKLLILIFSRFSVFQKPGLSSGDSNPSLTNNSNNNSNNTTNLRAGRKLSKRDKLARSTVTALTYPQANNAACLLAGAISGTSLLFIDSSERTTFALYGLTRAGEFFFRALAHTGRLPTWMTNFKHYDLLIMCLSACQILYCYVGHREALSPSYRNFLDKFGAKDVRVLNALEDKFRGWPRKVEDIKSFCVSQGLDPMYPFEIEDKFGCRMLHPRQACLEHTISFWIQGLRRGLWLYAPVHGVYTLLVLIAARRRRNRALRKVNEARREGITDSDAEKALAEVDASMPSLWTVFKKYLVNVGFSTMFLSTYCTIAWSAFCFMTQVVKEKRISHLRPTMLLPGLAALFETKPRRLELALYCLPRALEAFYNEQASFGYLPKVKNAEIGIFCLATAVFMCCFTQEPGSIKPSFLMVLNWLWT